jgi:hypothetical protein
MPPLMPLLCRGLTCDSSTCILIRPRSILGALAPTQPSQLRLFPRLFFSWCCSAPIQSTKKTLVRAPACAFCLLCLRLLRGSARCCVDDVVVSLCHGKVASAAVLLTATCREYALLAGRENSPSGCASEPSTTRLSSCCRQVFAALPIPCPHVLGHPLSIGEPFGAHRDLECLHPSERILGVTVRL